jgi:hypothetical protein
MSNSGQTTSSHGAKGILATMHHEWRAPAPTPGASTSAHRRQRAQAATSAGQVQNDTSSTRLSARIAAREPRV